MNSTLNGKGCSCVLYKFKEIGRSGGAAPNSNLQFDGPAMGSIQTSVNDKYSFIGSNRYASPLANQALFFNPAESNEIVMQDSRQSLEDLLILFERTNKKVIDMTRRLSDIEAESTKIRKELEGDQGSATTS